MTKGLSGKMTLHEPNAGGKSTLRRFHLFQSEIAIPEQLFDTYHRTTIPEQKEEPGSVAYCPLRKNVLQF